MFSKITLALAVAAAGLAGSAALPQSASANDGYGYGYGHAYDQGYGYEHLQHATQHKVVVTYVYKQILVKKKVVLYHPCGTPYYVWKTYYKTIKVPVYKKVPICWGH